MPSAFCYQQHELYEVVVVMLKSKTSVCSPAANTVDPSTEYSDRYQN